MKGRELWNAMRGIDPSYVTDAAPREKETVDRGVLLWRRLATVAACLILLLCAVPVAKRLMNGVTPGVIPPDTEPGTDVVENPDFIIENGVLLSYVGDETDIVIPEGVVKIAQQAFLSAPEITSIHLPESLEEIEPLTFAELLSLRSLSIDEENRYYEIVENALLKSDGTLLLLRQYGMEVSDILNEALFKIEWNGLSSELKRIELGNAEIELYDGQSMKSLSAFGQTITFSMEDEAYVWGNMRFRAFEMDDCFVICFYGPHYHNYNYILTRDGYYRIHQYTPEAEDWRSQSALSFYEENGELRYMLEARKFHGKQVVGQYIEACVTKNELYEENGLVIIEDGQLKLIPETRITVSEGLDLEAEYQEYVDAWGPYDPTIYGVSLNEFLLSNAKMFPQVCEDFPRLYFRN